MLAAAIDSAKMSFGFAAGNMEMVAAPVGVNAAPLKETGDGLGCGALVFPGAGLSLALEKPISIDGSALADGLVIAVAAGGIEAV